MNIEDIKKKVRNIPDFPIRGIQFKDITPVLNDAEALNWLNQNLYEHYKEMGISKVVGIESRGFILAPALAMKLQAGFVPIRKPGKLPAETVEVEYAKEYGVDKIQMHKDALVAEDVVLIHDDLLATGGTVEAAIELVKQFGVKKIYCNFIIELDALEGKKKLTESLETYSILHI